MELLAHHTTQHSTALNTQTAVVGVILLLAVVIISIWKDEQ
jgi:hypothetical protein